MITHKVLATQQGYEQLLDVLGDGLRNKEDPFLLFFMNTVEPVYKALCTSNTQLLFDTLDIKRYPITKKSEKVKWQELREQLAEARTKKAIDVLELVDYVDVVMFNCPASFVGLIDSLPSITEKPELWSATFRNKMINKAVDNRLIGVLIFID